MTSSVSTKMIIPSTINVGFRERKGTYTQKLAYVIYTDAKGVLRKEQSWQEWRDHKIEPKQFDNIPTSGFVLNKKVGGHKSGWNFRNAYVRVYDPRDFEFEITVPNLLYILEETSSIKGKGLDGEFVYAWDGKDLVLLPTCSEEYKQCANYTEKQSCKVGKEDIKEGATYLMKDMRTVMYLGKHHWAEETGWGRSKDFKPVGLRHIFVDLNDNSYTALTGYTKLASKLSDSSSEFADLYTKFQKSKFHKKQTGIEIKPAKPYLGRDKNGYGDYSFLLIKESDDTYKPVEVRPVYAKDTQYVVKIGDACKIDLTAKDVVPTFLTLENQTKERSIFSYNHCSNRERTYTIDQLKEMKFYTIVITTDRNDYDLLYKGFRSHNY